MLTAGEIVLPKRMDKDFAAITSFAKRLENTPAFDTLEKAPAPVALREAEALPSPTLAQRVAMEEQVGVRTTFNFTPFDPQEYVEDMVEQMNELVERKGLRLLSSEVRR